MSARAATQTDTWAIPARFNVRVHSARVAPVVITSSTRAACPIPVGLQWNAPLMFFLRAPAFSPDWAPVFRRLESSPLRTGICRPLPIWRASNSAWLKPLQHCRPRCRGTGIMNSGRTGFNELMAFKSSTPRIWPQARFLLNLKRRTNWSTGKRYARPAIPESQGGGLFRHLPQSRSVCRDKGNPHLRQPRKTRGNSDLHGAQRFSASLFMPHAAQHLGNSISSIRFRLA